MPNTRGRAGVGTKVHCNHGPAEAFREIIDWRPFSYFTTRGTTQFRGGLIPARQILETYEFTPQGGSGTLLTWRIRFVDRGAISMFMLRAIRLFFRGGIRHGSAKLQAVLEEDLGAVPAS